MEKAKNKESKTEMLQSIWKPELNKVQKYWMLKLKELRSHYNQ